MLAFIHTYFNWWIYIIQLGMFAIFHSFLPILKRSTILIVLKNLERLYLTKNPGNGQHLCK